MHKPFSIRAAAMLPIALALSAGPAHAGTQDDIAQIKQMLATMKKDYSTRIQQLEKRLAKAEQKARNAESKAQEAAQEAADAATAPVAAAPQSANAFNPGIGLVMNGRYRHFSRPASETAIPGFSLGEEASKGDEGLSLGESELGIGANIDDKFYGQFTASFVSDGGSDGIEIEEAFIQTLDLPAGLGLKAGRFLPGIGYLNSIHTHADDFADRPLPYRAMLNKAYKDDGLELRWLAPTDLFIELGADLLSGDHYPAGGRGHNGIGAWALFAHAGGDWDESNSWKAGLSYLSSEARDRESGDMDAPDTFTGHGHLWIADAIWKWAPHGNPYEHNLKLQGELFLRDEQGVFTPGGGLPADYSADQSGWYAQAIYQFMPRWRVGLRIAGLGADDPGTALAGSSLDTRGHDPRHYSAMLDWSNSEFSRLRFQYNHDASRPIADDQLMLQYVVALGAHGAHQF